MLTYSHIAALGCCAILLAGCGTRELSNIAPAYASESRNAPWPGFLPVDMVLTGDTGDFTRAIAETRAIEGRIHSLKLRAHQLRTPIIAPAERRRMTAATAKQQP